MTRELLQQALDALDYLGDTSDYDVSPRSWHASKAEAACTALREALAAPPAAPAPVVPEGDVVVSWNEDGQIVAVTRQDEEGRILSVIAESAAPVVREPLTDAFIDDIASAVFDLQVPESPAMEHLRAMWLESIGRPLARAIERAHGIGGGNG